MLSVDTLVCVDPFTCECSLQKYYSKNNSCFTKIFCTVPLDLNFIYAHAHKATARNVHGNAPE